MGGGIGGWAVGVLLGLLIVYSSLTCWNKGMGPEGIRRGLAG